MGGRARCSACSSSPASARRAVPAQIGLARRRRGRRRDRSRPAAADRTAAARLRRGPQRCSTARATALLRHDRAGWLAGVDPAATALAPRQAAFLTDIAAVPLGHWRYTVEPGDEAGRTEPGGGLDGPGHPALRAARRRPGADRAAAGAHLRAGPGAGSLAADDRPRPDGSDDLARALGARPAAWSGRRVQPGPRAPGQRRPAGRASRRPRTRWCRGCARRSAAGCPAGSR